MSDFPVGTRVRVLPDQYLHKFEATPDELKGQVGIVLVKIDATVRKADPLYLIQFPFKFPQGHEGGD